jgi:hypothetical protein
MIALRCRCRTAAWSTPGEAIANITLIANSSRGGGTGTIGVPYHVLSASRPAAVMR